MPTLKVWVKKTVQGPNGTIEIGLGGTHNVSCEPYQVPKERLALYQQYKAEVDRLIACELNGESVTPAPPPRKPVEQELEPEVPVDRERSRRVLAELQERLAQRGRSRENLKLGKSMDELLVPDKDT